MKTDIYIYIFFTSLSILLKIINISDKCCRETRNTHFMFNNLFFERRAVFEIMWKNVVEWGKPQMIKWTMRISCWIPTATNAHTSCVILIALPLQQRLHERAPM